MLIDLRPVFNGSVGELPVRFDFEADYSDKVSVSGNVVSRAGIVSIDLVARFTYTAPCDRCAVPVTRDYSVPIKHTVVTAVSNEDNDELLVCPDMQLDIQAVVNDDIIVGFPSKYLCSEDCKGLCPQCGKNLNEGGCQCSAKQIDPRLAVLKDLIK